MIRAEVRPCEMLSMVETAFAEIDYPVEGGGAEEEHEAALVRNVAATGVYEIQGSSKVSKVG